MLRTYLFLSVFILSSLLVQSQIITTVAGNGTSGYSGDGGPALNAQMGDMYYTYPAIDRYGNIYIAQNQNNTIRKIDAAGIITTIAGRNGIIGYSGDNGPAINALLYHPTCIAIDKDDNIIFADRNGSILRKIDPSGMITTISGQYTNQCKIGDGGPLVAAQLSAISGLTTDRAGNLYISEYGCNIVRKVNTAGIITTIAGNGVHGFSGDGGPATQAMLGYPTKVAVDNAGNIYIPDAHNHRIRKVNSTGIITTIAGNGTSGYSGDGGPAINASISYPGSVVIDKAGNLYIADDNMVIRKIDGSGTITTFAGTGQAGYSGDGGPAVLAKIFLSQGSISIDDNDNIYFANYIEGNVIRKISNCITASINQQPNDLGLCGSGNAVFYVDATNVTTFQWQVNAGTGWNDLTDNGIYSGSQTRSMTITGANTPMNNYKYRCLLSNNCGTISTKAANLMVTTPAAPSVTISADATNICAGTSVSFTAQTTNEGNTPAFHWMKNGLAVGANTPIYTDKALKDGDQISCQLTSGNSCLVGSGTVVSNSIPIKVKLPNTPLLTVRSSANDVCAGTPITFSTTATFEGTAPVYYWMRNGAPVGSNAPTFTDNTLKNGDIVHCELTTNESCVTNAQAVSNDIVLQIKPLITPAITIKASATIICPQELVSFQAIPQNEGPSPSYQWYKNNVAVGSNAATYVNASINNSDNIYCVLTSTAACLTSATATSSKVNMQVNAVPIVRLNKDTTLCTGASRVLDAGSFNSYLWNDGSTNRILTVRTTGEYSVSVTDQNGCKGFDTVNINKWLPIPYGFLPLDTSVCSYGTVDLKAKPGYKSYLWDNRATSSTITVSKPGQYWLEVTDANSCTGRDTIKVNPKECLQGFYIPSGFTPNGDGRNDVFRPLLFGNIKQYHFAIYDRWGHVVFESSTPGKGWDGTIQGNTAGTGTYVWLCNYHLEGEEKKQQKGTVVVIR